MSTSYKGNPQKERERERRKDGCAVSSCTHHPLSISGHDSRHRHDVYAMYAFTSATFETYPQKILISTWKWIRELVARQCFFFFFSFSFFITISPDAEYIRMIPSISIPGPPRHVFRCPVSVSVRGANKACFLLPRLHLSSRPSGPDQDAGAPESKLVLNGFVVIFAGGGWRRGGASLVNWWRWPRLEWPNCAFILFILCGYLHARMHMTGVIDRDHP